MSTARSWQGLLNADKLVVYHAQLRTIYLKMQQTVGLLWSPLACLHPAAGLNVKRLGYNIYDFCTEKLISHRIELGVQ